MRVLVVGLWGILLAAGCSKENNIDVAEGDPCASSDNGPDAIVCDDSCIDPNVSSAHCGSCGIACAAGGVCVEGSCRCPDNQTECSAVCVDLANNAQHCGQCGSECVGGRSCVAGACACAGDGITECGGECLDTTADELNCGACGRTCGPGQVCIQGACACPEGGDWSWCGGSCVDTANDAAHCGVCDTACAGACSQGTCRRIIDVAATASGMLCAAIENGPVRCQGNAGGGMITAETWAEEIAAGDTHFCARSGINVSCWGANQFGEAGRPPGTELITDPAVVDGFGASLLPVRLALGGYGSCAIGLADSQQANQLWCWGSNAAGQFASPPSSTSPLTKLTLPDGPSSAATSAGHTCATLGSTVYCLGSNALGELGIDPGVPAPTQPVEATLLVRDGHFARQVAVASGATCVRYDDGAIRCVGGVAASAGAAPGTSVDLALQQIVGISASSGFVCGWDQQGDVWCWGDGADGQLGQVGTTSVPVKVEGISGVTGLRASASSVCAWLNDGSAWCWGRNDFAQFGSAPSNQVITPTRLRFGAGG